MRALTDAEARVIAVLLAARPDRERDRLRIVDVPRSTYHAVRRRAYEEGWLRDRYVPHPLPLGFTAVTFVLARPFADRFDEFVSTVSAERGAVVVWAGPQVVLAVLFQPRLEEGDRLATRLESLRLNTSCTCLTVPADAPAVPVYFDYEGLWAHVVGLDGTLAYPHGLGGPGIGAGEGEEPAKLSPHQAWALTELLNRPFTASEGGRGGHLVGPLGLPFSQRRLLQKGWIVHRTILDPSKLPPYRGRAADQVVFLTGVPRAGARPEVLFQTLTRESRVYPFLFVAGEHRWLLGALGSSSPPGTEGGAVRRPVLPTLREHLEGIEVVQEPASGFLTPVDHRYDRIAPTVRAAVAAPAQVRVQGDDGGGRA